jgi:hypothetical protein
MESKAEAADPASVAGGEDTMAAALVSLHKEQTRLRTDHAATQAVAQAEHSARQDAVAALLADVTAMGTKSPEEQEALVARIAASMTSSAGAEAEDEEEKEGGGEDTRSELICDDEERRRYVCTDGF